jgi:hypothetical protein
MDGRRAQLIDPGRADVPTLERVPEAPPGPEAPAPAEVAPAAPAAFPAPPPRPGAPSAWRHADRLDPVSRGLARLRPTRPDRRLSDAWALALGLGWPLVFTVLPAFEPAPVDPAAPEPMIVTLGAYAFLAAMVVTIAAAVVRHRVAAVAAVTTGVVLSAFTLACPMSGHHTYGLWWIAELAIVGAMTAVSVAGLGRRALARPGARPR